MTTTSCHKQPSELGLLEEQSIIVFPSLPTTAENSCKQPPDMLDDLTPEVPISNPSGNHSPTQPMQPTAWSNGTLIMKRLCVFLLMCLQLLQQLYPCCSSIKLDKHHPPNYCNRLQSLLANHLWPTALLQAVLLFTVNSHSHPLHRRQWTSDASNYLHLTLEHSNSTVSHETDPNLLLLSARRLSRSIYFYQRWEPLPHLHHLADGAFFSYLTDFTATNTVLHGLSIWNDLRQCSKTLTVKNISYSYHLPFFKLLILLLHIPAGSLQLQGLWKTSVESISLHGPQVMNCLLKPLINYIDLDSMYLYFVEMNYLKLLQPWSPLGVCPGKKPLHLTNNKYLQTVLSRTKWTKTQPNSQEGDMVIIKEDKHFSCHWPLAKLIKPIQAVMAWLESLSSRPPPAHSRGQSPSWPSYTKKNI